MNRKNPKATTVSIEDVDVFPFPAAEVADLTDEERARLADPDWVTEDEADGIVSIRSEKSGSISFEQYLRDRSHGVDR